MALSLGEDRGQESYPTGCVDGRSGHRVDRLRSEDGDGVDRAAAPGPSTRLYASAATLYEVALNHFIRGKGAGQRGDQVYFQGHASPGMYARAFLEGRLTQEQLENFRNELEPGGGLSSYPHPWLMPGFWEFPTV